MKLTRHNGRAGKNGAYNPKHNDRSFNINNSEHIDEERAKGNIYWDCFNGYRTFYDKENECKLANTFEEVEELYYSIHYKGFIEGQNERNIKNRHPERNRTTSDILKHKKTCPEETIYQIGTLDNHVSPDILLQVVMDFMVEITERFGTHVHILDWALRLDESTPHIYERHVFDCENQYEELFPQQEKALEKLGFDLPNSEKPAGQNNNRKMVFDSACRALLFDIAKNYGLQLEELTMKIEDIEALIDEVADIAYDKAVEVVTDTVKKETHLEDIRLIEESKNWVLSPERKTSKKEREYAAKRLDGVIAKIKNAMQSAVQKIQTKLMQPEVKRAGTEQIKTKARASVLDKLNRKKEAIRQNSSGIQFHRKYENFNEL